MIFELLELIGAVCEITGAFMMANALLGLIGASQVPKHLASALINGKLARGFSRIGGLTGEDHRQSLRGLAFLAVGFLLKSIIIAWRIFAELTRAHS